MFIAIIMVWLSGWWLNVVTYMDVGQNGKTVKGTTDVNV